MFFCTGWGATDCLIIIASPHIFTPLSLSILLISLPYSCLEEMKDHVESSEEPDSTLTDSIQSKGKGRRGSTRARSLARSYLAHVSIYKRILISGHSCWIKIHFIRRILSAVQPSVTQLHLSCLRFFSPVCLHLLLSVGAGGRQAVCTCSSRAKCICKSSLPISGPQLWPWYFGINVSARLWRLSVMNYLQTSLSDI